jgi:hypothetical protein
LRLRLGFAVDDLGGDELAALGEVSLVGDVPEAAGFGQCKLFTPVRGVERQWLYFDIRSHTHRTLTSLVDRDKASVRGIEHKKEKAIRTLAWSSRRCSHVYIVSLINARQYEDLSTHYWTPRYVGNPPSRGTKRTPLQVSKQEVQSRQLLGFVFALAKFDIQDMDITRRPGTGKIGTQDEPRRFYLFLFGDGPPTHRWTIVSSRATGAARTAPKRATAVVVKMASFIVACVVCCVR